MYILPTLWHILSAGCGKGGYKPAISSAVFTPIESNFHMIYLCHSQTVPTWWHNIYSWTWVINHDSSSPFALVTWNYQYWKEHRSKKREKISLSSRLLNAVSSALASCFRDMWDGYHIKCWHNFTVTCTGLQSWPLTYNTCFISSDIQCMLHISLERQVVWMLSHARVYRS